MLSKAIANKVNEKLILTNTSKRELAISIGKSYHYVINVLNRKKSSKSIELLLKKYSEE